MHSSLGLIHDIIDSGQRRSLIDHWSTNPRGYSELTSDNLGVKLENQDVSCEHPAVKSIANYVHKTYPTARENLHQRSSYLLNYQQGSFMRPHTDNKGVYLTCVTLLGVSTDLYGGVPFFVDDEDEQKIFSAHISPGQSLIYPRRMMHGVSVIEKGTRLVLVSWFGKKQIAI